MKKLIIIPGVLILLAYGVFEWYQIRTISLQNKQNYTPQTNVAYQQKDSFSYKGQEGKDGLTLLKEKTTVEQESSGLVSSINGRKADSKKHEYWAFYVNGKMAEVGPADYKTKEGDIVEWKVEKY